MRNAIYFQSGGPTQVINASFYGVIKGYLKHQDEIGILYGSRYGIEGIINDDLVVIEKDISIYEEIKEMNGAILGSARLKLKGLEDPKYAQILETFRKYDIGYVFVNGGNDSMDTADKLNKYFEQAGYDCIVIGIPKTIDNDLVNIDHTPGYGSASKYIVRTVMEVALDLQVYSKGRVTLMEMMGRDSGWLTACSAAANLYNLGPDLIYLPEVPFDMKKFLKDVKEVYERKGYAFVCVSEALKNEKGEYVSSIGMVDVFGHQQLGSIGRFLEDVINQQLHIKTRSIELSLLQRASSHIQSNVDREEAILVGEKAVDFAINHDVGMVTIVRESTTPYKVSYQLTPLKDVANAIKTIPLEWINEERNGVTQEMIDYVRPLIDESEIAIKSGNLFLKKEK